MRRLVAVVVLSLVLPVNALAYDTFWHSASSGGVAQHYKFSPDVTNILQLGTFAPDLFGPAYDKVLVKLNAMLTQSKAPGASIRKAGVFMHFDNLDAYLDANWKYDYLFTRLAFNTAQTITAFYKDPSLNEGTRKILVLETLGSSLHMLQDFYSHSDWTHFDFVKMGFPQKQSDWGVDYAPSWFQVRAVLGSPPTTGPETWPIQPHSGIYPPPATVPLGNNKIPMSHTNMNHDNSQLFYLGASQIKYHGYGAHPATDDASATQHQLYSVSSAAMASVEWVSILVQLDPTVQQAIDDVKDWDLKKFNPAMLKNLTAGLALALGASCAVTTWDGPKPPEPRKSQCGGAGTNGRIGGAVVALGAAEGVAWADEFWAPYFTKNILEKLTDGIGDQATGKYAFDKAWLAARRVPPANTTAVHLANGLTVDAPTGATSSSNGTSVTISSPDLGTVQIDTSSGETASQAASEAHQQQPGDPPLTPDPPVIDPPDWMLGNGGMLVAQRTINGKTYRCSASGLTAAQYKNARLALRGLR